MLVRTKSLMPCSFRLVQARSLVSYSLGSCGLGALLSHFMLVRTRSVVPCSLDSCGRGELVLPFMLVQTKSFVVTFYARADQECCAMQFRSRAGEENLCCLLCSCRPGALCHAV
ncbi:hypothetical protein ACFX12_028592 [Malus domestica]